MKTINRNEIEMREEKSKKERNYEFEIIIYNGNFYRNFYIYICILFREEINRSEKSVVPLGFDLEWPFSFQTGSGKTALVQICLDVDVCYLLHIYSLNKLPAAFVELLCHPKVKLVGINIKKSVIITSYFNLFFYFSENFIWEI